MEHVVEAFSLFFAQSHKLDAEFVHISITFNPLYFSQDYYDVLFIPAKDLAPYYITGDSDCFTLDPYTAYADISAFSLFSYGFNAYFLGHYLIKFNELFFMPLIGTFFDIHPAFSVHSKCLLYLRLL